MNIKRIALSLGVVVFVGAVVAGATGAFFSDTETSTGNTFTAGAIDLTVDNESYYNGEVSTSTSWLQPKNLEEGDLFFNFTDLKPGDWGEDTISLHVNSNDAYACVAVTLDSNDDLSSTEPELEEEGEVEDVEDDINDGELADRVEFIWWADDGDNVFEDGEVLLPAGNLGSLDVEETAIVALAEPNEGGVFEGALTGDQVYYIGKAWCFGEFNIEASTHPQDGDGNPAGGPDERPIVCDGAGEGNITQTDGITATISFTAVQARNNDNFSCETSL